MPQIPIKRAIEKVPGGMMVVPLLLGAPITTFFPNTPKFFGSFAGALFSGSLTILAVSYVRMGASIDLKATPSILKKGSTLFAVKVGMTIVPGVIFGRPLGEAPVSSGLFAGISTLAIIASMAAGPATVLVVATVVVTAILVPLATAWTVCTFGRPEEDAVEDAAVEVGAVPAGTAGGH